MTGKQVQNTNFGVYLQNVEFLIGFRYWNTLCNFNLAFLTVDFSVGGLNTVPVLFNE